MHDRENVIQSQNIGLQCLVDFDRWTNWVPIICRGPYVLVHQMNESAVIQACEKGRGISPACSWTGRTIKIDRILFCRSDHRPAVVDQVSGIKTWFRQAWNAGQLLVS